MTLLSNKRMNLLDVFEPGTFHIDTFDLPNPPDDSDRRHLFVAMDQATRWVYVRWHRARPEACSADFPHQLGKASPMSVQRIITDCSFGIEGRSTGICRPHSGRQLLEFACLSMRIELRISAPLRPTECGMVERFIRGLYSRLRQVQSGSDDDLVDILRSYRSIYNQADRQSALADLAPMQALRGWRRRRPELFRKQAWSLADTAKVRLAKVSRDQPTPVGLG